MSSPLFYPRVQWWEYDFRYRGDLKASLKIGTLAYKARVTDLRRGAACVECFEKIPLNEEVLIEVYDEDFQYEIQGIVKTSKEIIQGRPIRYGVDFFIRNEKEKTQYNSLRKTWKKHNNVKLRRKFEDLNEEKDDK